MIALFRTLVFRAIIQQSKPPTFYLLLSTSYFLLSASYLNKTIDEPTKKVLLYTQRKQEDEPT